MKNRYVDELRAEAGLEEEDEIPEENILPVLPGEEEKTVRETMKTVFFFMGVLFLIEAVIVLLFIGGPLVRPTWDKWKALLGLVVGEAFGVLWFLSISSQIRHVLDLQEHQAKNSMRLGAVLRFLLLAAVVVGAYFTRIVDPILILVGVFNLKLSAFLSGFFNKKHA